MLPAIVIRLLLSGALALAIGRFVIKDKAIRQSASSAALNGIWAYVLALKVSLLITHFSAVLSEPLLLLYGWGGTVNMLIGALSVIGYFVWFLLKKSPHQKPHALFMGAVLVSFLTFFMLVPHLMPSEERASEPTELSILSDLKSIDGTNIPFNASQITVVNFWATWCPPCRAEMPELDAFAKEHSDVNFIGVNNISSEREGLDGVKQFLQSKGYTFTTTLDYNDALSKEFSVKSFPTTVILGPGGELLHRQVGVISKSTLEGFLTH